MITGLTLMNADKLKNCPTYRQSYRRLKKIEKLSNLPAIEKKLKNGPTYRQSKPGCFSRSDCFDWNRGNGYDNCHTQIYSYLNLQILTKQGRLLSNNIFCCLANDQALCEIAAVRCCKICEPRFGHDATNRVS